MLPTQKNVPSFSWNEKQHVQPPLTPQTFFLLRKLIKHKCVFLSSSKDGFDQIRLPWTDTFSLCGLNMWSQSFQLLRAKTLSRRWARLLASSWAGCTAIASTLVSTKMNSYQAETVIPTRLTLFSWPWGAHGLNERKRVTLTSTRQHWPIKTCSVPSLACLRDIHSKE